MTFMIKAISKESINITMMPIDTSLNRKYGMIHSLAALIAKSRHILLVGTLCPIHLWLLLSSHSLSSTFIIIMMSIFIIIDLMIFASIFTHSIHEIRDFS